MTGELLATLAARHGTPVWVYDAAVIERQLARLARFDVVRYAQKANSNVHLLRLLRSGGACVDAVSGGEIERALAAGFAAGGPDPAPIVFTADVIDGSTLARVVALGIPVNAGSPDMLAELPAGHPVWLRINPGFGHGHSRKTNTGGEHSKHGIWHTRLPEVLALVNARGLELVGLHMHIGSGADYRHLERVCHAMVRTVRDVVQAGGDLRAVSAGGGLAVPYSADEPEVDTARYLAAWDAARTEIARLVGHRVELEIEPGRFLVAQAGVLVAEVRAVKEQGSRRFVIVDAGFNDLVRPAMYGAMHGVSALRADGSQPRGPLAPAVVAGPLCESGDVFTQDASGRVLSLALPPVSIGDRLVFHDGGAYGASMSSNYNSRPLAAEVLVRDGEARLIRRRQTIEELLALEDV